MRSFTVLGAGLVLLAAPLGAVDGHAQQVDQRLSQRLSTDLATTVAAQLDTADAQGLPTESLIQKALEGSVKGASEDVIARAVRDLRLRLGEAAHVLGPVDEAELVAAAAVLSQGVPGSEIRAMKTASPDRSIALPLVILSDLIVRGVEPASASGTLLDLSRAGVDDGQLGTFRQRVIDDIASGALPTAAMQTRARGVLANRPPGGAV